MREFQLATGKKIEKVILISPPFCYFPGLASKKTNYLRVPLGLCYLASYIRKNNNIKSVEIIDAPALGWSLEDIKNKLISYKPDLIGVSVVTPNVNMASQISILARKLDKDSLVVAGGPHVTAMPEDLLKTFDLAVVGEGEETLSELIKSLQEGRGITDIDGIAYKENGKIKLNPKRKFISDLNSIPFPALDLLEISHYKHIYPYNRNGKIASILTSRGCPYNCYFCGNNSLWSGSLRYRSVNNVIEEVKYLKNNLGISFFWIDDDLFGPENRVVEFCENIIAQNLDVKWNCHMRCNGVSEKNLFLMKKAGCLEIQVGVESGNDNVLKALNKNLTVEQTRSFFRSIQKVKINTWATFIFGSYADNDDSISDSVKLAKEIDPTYVTFMHLLPLPGTKIFSDYSAKGFIKTYDWSRYNWHNDPVFETDSLSLNDLIGLKKKAYLEFYLRPKKILIYFIQCLKTGSWKLMFRNFIIFIKLSLNK